MKANRITQAILTAILGIQMGSLVFAADLIVEENGVAPNFATVQAAVNAASSGDRIFVKNKAGGAYVEAVTIDKPVSLLAFESNGIFNVAGDYTISPSAANFTAGNKGVRIVGMNNTNGGLTAFANNATGSVIMVDVHGSQLSGSIALTGTGYAARISGNVVSGISAREANVIGNQVTDTGITINDASGTTALGDTLYIVGNRLATIAGGAVMGLILYNNDDHYFHIANNWVNCPDLTDALRVNSLKGGTNTNFVINNSLSAVGTSGGGNGVVRITTTSSGTRLTISNNAFRGSTSGVGTAVGFITIIFGSVVEVSHNVMSSNLVISNVSASLVGLHDNETAAVNALNPDNITGVCTDALCVNGGNPGNDFIDHDTSRNDVGVAGGSFNPSNFWPIQTGSARVYLVKTPRTVVQSSTINAKADSYDR